MTSYHPGDEAKMTPKYIVELTTSELDSLRRTLAGAPGCTVEEWSDPESSIITVAINETALAHLDNLPEYTDWTHDDGNLYADGAAYPLTVVRN
jgi:hypothetical protein